MLVVPPAEVRPPEALPPVDAAPPALVVPPLPVVPPADSPPLLVAVLPPVPVVTPPGLLDPPVAVAPPRLVAPPAVVCPPVPLVLPPAPLLAFPPLPPQPTRSATSRTEPSPRGSSPLCSQLRGRRDFKDRSMVTPPKPWGSRCALALPNLHSSRAGRLWLIPRGIQRRSALVRTGELKGMRESQSLPSSNRHNVSLSPPSPDFRTCGGRRLAPHPGLSAWLRSLASQRTPGVSIRPWPSISCCFRFCWSRQRDVVEFRARGSVLPFAPKPALFFRGVPFDPLATHRFGGRIGLCSAASRCSSAVWRTIIRGS